MKYLKTDTNTVRLTIDSNSIEFTIFKSFNTNLKEIVDELINCGFDLIYKENTYTSLWDLLSKKSLPEVTTFRLVANCKIRPSDLNDQWEKDLIENGYILDKYVKPELYDYYRKSDHWKEFDEFLRERIKANKSKL